MPSPVISTPYCRRSCRTWTRSLCSQPANQTGLRMSKRFHLAWFTNFTVGNWDGTFSHGGSPWDGRFFVDMALALERACFDYVIYEDKLLVPEAYRSTAETTLKLAQQVPKHDPGPRAALVAAATSRFGVVASVDAGLASVHAGPGFKHDRSHRRRALRLEHRDQRRGPGSPEFSPRRDAA